MYWLGFILFAVLGFVLIITTFIFYHRWWPHGSKIRTVLENVTLVLVGIFVILLLVEIFFKLFFAQTDGYTFVLAMQNWYQKNWHPINTMEYRDQEWLPEDVEGKTKIMVVGDSFAAGLGIDNVEDRFSNQLGKLMGTDYVVFNVASPGWSTKSEIEAMVSYPYSPDILILSYFINDIEQAAYDRGVNRPKFVQKPGGMLGFVVDNSYALNFVYWRWYRISQPPLKPNYIDWLQSLYQDPEIWWQHRQELSTIIAGTKAEGVPLLVVVFPNLADVDGSRLITEKVKGFFREDDILVLDMASFLANHDPDDTTVNAVDTHPNEMVNKEVAEQLYQMIQSEIELR